MPVDLSKVLRWKLLTRRGRLNWWLHNGVDGWGNPCHAPYTHEFIVKASEIDVNITRVEAVAVCKTMRPPRRWSNQSMLLKIRRPDDLTYSIAFLIHASTSLPPGTRDYFSILTDGTNYAELMHSGLFVYSWQIDAEPYQCHLSGPQVRGIIRRAFINDNK